MSYFNTRLHIMLMFTTAFIITGLTSTLAYAQPSRQEMIEAFDKAAIHCTKTQSMNYRKNVEAETTKMAQCYTDETKQIAKTTTPIHKVEKTLITQCVAKERPMQRALSKAMECMIPKAQKDKNPKIVKNLMDQQASQVVMQARKKALSEAVAYVQEQRKLAK